MLDLIISEKKQTKCAVQMKETSLKLDLNLLFKF